MKDHSENTLGAAIKALRETVAPALGPKDPQASEQLRLTVDFLEFLRTHLYDFHARLRYELRNQLEVARAIQNDAVLVSERAGELLSSAIDRASSAYGDPDTHTRDLDAASAELWGRVRGVLREAREAPTAVRERISENVLAGLEPLIEFESSWYLPLGFIPDPGAVADLSEFLPTKASART